MNILIFSHDLDIGEFRDRLAADFPEMTFRATREEKEAIEYVGDADILVTLRPSNELLARAGRVKWIHAIIAGTDYIEKLPAFQVRQDVILTSTRGIHGPAVSELAILFMIALNRGFHRNVLNKRRRTWERWSTTLLYGKKAAILAMGTIGRSLARKCKAFDMTVYGIGPNPKQIDELDAFFLLPELNAVASQVDYFVSIAPNTTYNQKFLDAVFFAAMKPSAFFINVGRGEVVDEDALVQALREGSIAGAGLDTFQQEPLPAEHPLWGLDNVLLTPHVGGLYDTYIRQAVEIFKKNLKRYVSGEHKDMINLVARGQTG